MALTAVTLTILELSNQIVLEPGSKLYWLDTGILVVFTIDYFTRLIMAKDKKDFIKSNIFHLIAIIPFSSLFRIFRAFKFAKVFRMARFVKGFALLGKLENRLRDFVNTNGFIYAIYISVLTVVLGAVGIYFLEYNQVGVTFGDSLWWSFVTASTVGFVDMAPETGGGRLIAVVLMIVGIGFVGMLTGTITTYFLNFRKSSENNLELPKIIDVSDLDGDEVKQIADYIDFIRNKSNKL